MEETSSPSNPPAAGRASPSPGIHAEPGDHEEVYYEGSPPSRVRGHTGRIALYSLISLIFPGHRGGA